MCEVGEFIEFTPMEGDTGCVVGLDNVQNLIARRYPETTKLRFRGVWNFFEDQQLVAQVWEKDSDSWWVVVKKVEETS